MITIIIITIIYIYIYICVCVCVCVCVYAVHCFALRCDASPHDNQGHVHGSALTNCAQRSEHRKDRCVTVRDKAYNSAIHKTGSACVASFLLCFLFSKQQTWPTCSFADQ